MTQGFALRYALSIGPQRSRLSPRHRPGSQPPTCDVGLSLRTRQNVVGHHKFAGQLLYFQYCGIMESSQAQEAFGALSQETRLAILRFLLRGGRNAVPAGQIAEALKVQPSTFSFHVAALERAGLVKSQRMQRQILYSPNLDVIRELLEFLLNDCCGGRPEICANLLPKSRPRSDCCPPATSKRSRVRA